ncbi:MAG: hypothetical protein F4X59_10950 [Holophagales bacterium]|nr:hypothetical protein [Holophagales bacterium]MXX61405.1 hypothetical protein [Holophagales bacterium]MYC10638.1 hypothetical protein [Holophagales bacterium]MYD24055.1 hypothetical protein [Holophagales bacterium]MYI32268.1 hypothetical protein [Holophagales bacterium]
MTSFLQSTWSVLAELAPWLLFGALLAALLHVLLPRNLIRRQLSGYGGAVKAVVLGVPLPLCSCGVIPAGIGLKRTGASNGSAMGFLISTPQTGVDSILVSATFLGWPFALFKVAAAAVTGIAGGWWVEGMKDDGAPVEDEAPAEEAGVESGGHRIGGTVVPKITEMIDHGGELLQSIWRWVAVGILVSAAIEVLLPQQAWLDLAALGTFGAAAAALVISLPLYVCATASVPIAAALVANGLPLGAALVFLMAGPATNVATVGAVYRGFGRKVTAVYLTTVIVGSLGFAVLFESLIGGAAVRAGHAHEHGVPWWAATSAILLVLMFGWFGLQEFRRWRRNVRADRWSTEQVAAGEPGGRAVEIAVTGMTCGNCADAVESALLAAPGVQAARVDLTGGTATVWGATAASTLREAVQDAGFGTP